MAFKRTDVHRPAVINPTEYQFVAFDYVKDDDIGASFFLAEQRAIKAAHFKRTGGRWSGHDHGGSCGICGNVNAIYTVCFWHEPSNTYIHVGDTCAQQLDFAGQDGNFEAFKTNIKHASELKAGKRKAQHTLTEAGLARVWDIYEAYEALDYSTRPEIVDTFDEFGNVSGYDNKAYHEWNRVNLSYEKDTIRDIVRKIIKYGDPSDKVINYLGVLVNKIDNKVALEAQRAAEKELAKDAPNGRATITGEVLKVKLQEGFYGAALKASVKSPDGFIVYGTLPRAYDGAKRGDTVTFTATFEPKEDDKKFAFFKRPTVKAADEKAWTDRLEAIKAEETRLALVEEASKILETAQRIEASRIKLQAQGVAEANIIGYDSVEYQLAWLQKSAYLQPVDTRDFQF